MKNIAIFASGEGTNAQNLINYFQKSITIKVAIVVCNKAEANVLNRAQKANIPTLLINKESFYSNNSTIDALQEYDIDSIVLAGFLWLIPENLIEAFSNKIINLHPALLPKFGGKGMYGNHVHRAVVEAKEKESGITIHYVNSEYDEGAIVAQYSCDLTESETPETLAVKIHNLEQEFLPITIEQILNESQDD